MTKALIVGDVHISDHPPSSRTPTYTDDAIAKLEFCVEKANELDVPLVQAGDLFHIKTASKNSHALVQRVHAVLSRVAKGVFIVPGNHDMSHDRLQSLDKQPLGSLCRMEGVHMLIGEHKLLAGIAGVPYISQFDNGGWWQGHMRDYHEDFGITEPELLVTHAPIFPPGKAPTNWDSMDPEDWAEYWIGVPATYYGHIHEDHGIYMNPDKTMEFCNHGALLRGSLTEASKTRKPAATYWDGTTFERIEVPHKPASEVFLLAQAARKVENKTSALAFAQAVDRTKLTALTLDSVLATLRAEVPDKQVLAVIEQVLDETQ